MGFASEALRFALASSSLAILSARSTMESKHEKIVDCSQSYFLFSCIFIRSLNVPVGSRQNWTPAQKEDFTGWAVGIIITALSLSSHKDVSYPDLSRFSLCLSLHKQSFSLSTA